jgi:hypothetical protein
MRSGAPGRKGEESMALTASWVHGNALIVETPGNCAAITRFGWGTALDINPGTDNWFHIPIPTPVLIKDARAQLFRVFILFATKPGDGIVSEVRVFDGKTIIRNFGNLHLEGNFEDRIVDGFNMFTLATPHSTAAGIGVSFHFLAATGIDSSIPPTRVECIAAGADFNM